MWFEGTLFPDFSEIRESTFIVTFTELTQQVISSVSASSVTTSDFLKM